ncbi:hypothetical protein B4U80_03437, partial [Leptotrombidium deliense]
MDARINLGRFIENIVSVPFFSGFVHLQCYAKYFNEFNFKILEARKIIESAASTTTSITESQRKLKTLIDAAKEDLEKEEGNRQQSKFEVTQIVKQLEQLMLGKAKTLSPNNEQHVKIVIDNATKWLDQHPFALSTEYAGYATYLSNEYNAVQQQIEQDNLRILTRRELYNKMLTGVNKNNLNDKQISLIKTSANGILEWHSSNVDASIVQIEEKISEIENLEQSRLIIIDENENTIITDKSFIGIDLGTLHCCLAIFRNSKVEVVNLEGKQSRMPSYVAIDDNKIL